MNVDQRLIQQIKSRYNSDYDSCPDGPNVRWAEFTLAVLVESQQRRIEELEAKIEQLVAAIPSAGPPKNDGSNRGRHKLFKA